MFEATSYKWVAQFTLLGFHCLDGQSCDICLHKSSCFSLTLLPSYLSVAVWRCPLRDSTILTLVVMDLVTQARPCRVIHNSTSRASKAKHGLFAQMPQCFVCQKGQTDGDECRFDGM